MYSAVVVLADPEKIDHIVQLGRPETMRDIGLLLQAATYSAL